MRFRVVIEERPGPRRPGIWAGFVVPADVSAAFAPRADGGPRKRVPVRGTLAGVDYRSSATLLPDGTYEFIAGLDERQRAGVALGDEVDVEMAEDSGPRELEPPADVARALAAAGLRDRWDAIPWSHRHEFVRYLNDAKRPETRIKRVGQVVSALEKSPPAGVFRGW
jgi:hypothetical protein